MDQKWRQEYKVLSPFCELQAKKKFIWEINDEVGVSHSGQEAIKMEATKFFKSFFNDTGQNSIVNQINTVRMYPNIVREEEQRLLEQACHKG
jgi:hypothetical protein